MDLAVSFKQKADRTVVMTIAVDASNRWYIVDLAMGKYNPSEVIDILFKQVRKWRPIEVRTEKAALQQVLGHFIDERMMKENTHFLSNQLELNTTTKKEVRIVGLQPKFKQGKIFLPTDRCQEEIMLLEKEILGQTRETNITGHDDGIDTLANFLDPNFVITPSDYDTDYYGDIRNLEIHDPTVF